MSRQLNVTDAQARLPALILTLREGEAVRIVHAGQAVAVLITTAEYHCLAGAEVEDWANYAALCARNQLDELDLQVV